MFLTSARKVILYITINRPLKGHPSNQSFISLCFNQPDLLADMLSSTAMFQLILESCDGCVM